MCLCSRPASIAKLAYGQPPLCMYNLYTSPAIIDRIQTSHLATGEAVSDVEMLHV